MNNNSISTETILKATNAYWAEFGKDAVAPDRVINASGGWVILSIAQTRIAAYNIHDEKIHRPIGGFKTK